MGYSLESAIGSAYYSLVMQACGTVNSPPIILQNGTAGNSTIYTNSTSAKVKVPAPVPAYHPNGYSVLSGTYVSGTVPTSVELLDPEYFVVQSAWSSQTSTSYNPSGYNLLGSTTLDSGSVSNLKADDDVYITLKSSASNFFSNRQ